MSAIVANATLFPAFTASTASAGVRSLLPVSQADEFQLGKRQNAIAIAGMRSRSQRAFLTVVRRDILSALLTPRLSRTVSSSISVSSASIQVTSPSFNPPQRGVQHSERTWHVECD
ncbi:hypothetical protein [Bradyrhizobium sp. 193]|uniref:hypothetical protein n=1 Tax=Bradyrhizobium sp. 193 TaxID=2782661 RepID=UPI003211954F